MKGDVHQLPTSHSQDAFFAAVRGFEKDRGHQTWCMVHPPGSWHICYPTYWDVVDNLDSIGTGREVDVLVHSPGGHADIAYFIMKVLRRRYQKVNVVVPFLAKSAATLMCLGADEVLMGEIAELGPIDVQIDDPVQHGARTVSPLDEFKSLEFLREQSVQWMDYYATVINRRYGLSLQEALRDSIPLVTGMMRPMLEQLDPLEMGGHRRALAIGEEYARRMLALAGYKDPGQIVRKLVWDYPSHDFKIDRDEAAGIGLPIKDLAPNHDLLLTKALNGLNEEDAHHGFVPKQSHQNRPPGADTNASAPSVRGQVQTRNKRTNGRAGDSAEER